MNIKKTSAIAIAALSFIIIALGCADYGDPPTNSSGTVSFAADIQDTLAVQCAKSGCHGIDSSQGGFTMGNVTWSEIRNGSGNHGLVVIPGNASASNLFLKTTASPPFGTRMPNDGPPYLSIQAQTAIRDWINQGALDN